MSDDLCVCQCVCNVTMNNNVKNNIKQNCLLRSLMSMLWWFGPPPNCLSLQPWSPKISEYKELLEDPKSYARIERSYLSCTKTLCIRWCPSWKPDWPNMNDCYRSELGFVYRLGKTTNDYPLKFNYEQIPALRYRVYLARISPICCCVFV